MSGRDRFSRSAVDPRGTFATLRIVKRLFLNETGYPMMRGGRTFLVALSLSAAPVAADDGGLASLSALARTLLCEEEGGSDCTPETPVAEPVETGPVVIGDITLPETAARGRDDVQATLIAGGLFLGADGVVRSLETGGTVDAVTVNAGKIEIDANRTVPVGVDIAPIRLELAQQDLGLEASADE